MYRLPAQVLAVAVSFLFLAGFLGAQTIQSERIQSTLPLVPMTVRFRFVPQYFEQTIGDDLRYSRIEALIDNDPKRPWYEVILTDRTTGRRVFYCNSLETVMALKGAGTDAYTAEIGFALVEEPDSPPAYHIRLRDNRGQGIHWQFVVSTRATHPAGLLPRPNRLGLVLMFGSSRSDAATGTTVTIGKESRATDWSGAASAYPPFYFTGLTVAEIVPTEQLWSVVSTPAALRKGERWVLLSPGGRRRLLVIESVSDHQVLINQVDEDNPDVTSAQLDVERLNDSLALHSVRLTNQSLILQISFAPNLPLPACGLEDKTDVHFTVEVGAKSVIASGTASVRRALDAEHMDWHFDAPDWARANRYETGVNVVPVTGLDGSAASSRWCGAEPGVYRNPLR